MLPSNYQCEGQMSLFEFVPELLSGKMSQEPSVQTKEKTLDASLKNWQESKTLKFQYLCLKSGSVQELSNFLTELSHGEPTTLNIGESPKEERESHLSWILETNPNPKYNLSPKACQGILNRANRRGKKLPELLEKVLIQQSVSKSVAENLGGEKEYLSKPIEQEPCLAKTTKPYCIGNGQLHDALTPSETCKTLNTMADPMKVVCVGNGQLMQLKESEKVGALNCMHDQQAVLCIDQGGGKSMANVSVDQAPTLTTTHYGEPAVCYGLDRASFNQGQNAQFDFSVESDMAQTLVSKGPGGVMQTK